MAKNRMAVQDGKLVRQRVRATGKYRLDADEVVKLVKRHIRRTMGDWMENNADVHASNGYFHIRLPYRRPLNAVADDFWRAAFRQGLNLRRYSIGLALRAMHGEVLT